MLVTSRYTRIYKMEDFEIFTNEFEWDATVTTVLDESGQNEDVELVIDDFGVFIRQFNERQNRYDLVSMTHEMFQEFLIAVKSKEGAYKIMR